MIPLNIAKALKRVAELGEPPNGGREWPGVHLVTDEEDTAVFVETTNQFMCVQITYDDASLEKDWFDIVIPHDEVQAMVKSKGTHSPDFAEFDESDDWEHFAEVIAGLDAGSTDSVNFFPKSGIQLHFLYGIVAAFKDVFGQNANIMIAQKEYAGPIRIQTDFRYDDIEMIVHVMPKLLWGGEDE
jgi:hypothetical protein